MRRLGDHRGGRDLFRHARVECFGRHDHWGRRAEIGRSLDCTAGFCSAFTVSWRSCGLTSRGVFAGTDTPM